MIPRWAAGKEGGVRRLTFTERVADWLVDGRYSDALAMKAIAVQTAATRPLRAQLAHDEDEQRR